MINILILDDNASKAKKITEILNAIDGCKIESASDLVTARLLLQKPFDLLILDMNLPERFNEVPKENTGLLFVDELKKSSRLKLPKAIIGLTEFENIVDKYEKSFEKNGIVLIRYDIKGSDWQVTLKEKVKYHLRTNEEGSRVDDYQYDVAIITALRDPELQSVLDLNYNWEKKKQGNDTSYYHFGNIQLNDQKNLKIVCTSLAQMGLVSCAFSTVKLIEYFRPRYIIMTGICGGIKGSVSLGDIVISESSFDLGSGKIIRGADGGDGFEPDFKSIPLVSELRDEFIELRANKNVLRKIKDSWKGNAINGELDLKIGPVGSGAAVIANSSYTDKIKSHQRKLIAIDMETYSVFYCCNQSGGPRPTAISIKGVCDFADHEKNDNIQKYCSHISAMLADYIIKNILPFEF